MVSKKDCLKLIRQSHAFEFDILDAGVFTCEKKQVGVGFFNLRVICL